MELINLKRLSAICIASTVWQRPEIKPLIKELYQPSIKSEFPNFFRPGDSRYQNFQLIIQIVLRYLNSLELPLHLKNYCQDIVRELGERIYDYIKYINYKFGFHIKWYEKISWSPYGTIDECKIFKKWESDKEFLKETEIYFMYYSVKFSPAYLLACINAQEDFIENHKDELEKILQERNPKFNLKNYDYEVYTLLSVTLSCYINQDNASNINYEDLAIPPEKMFKLSAFHCYPKTTHYFWNAIKEFDGYQEQCLMEASKKCVEIIFYNDDNYEKIKLAEVMNFLINQMNENQKKEFFKKNLLNVFWCILPAWPFNQRIINQLINDFLGNLTEDEYQTLALDILRMIYEKEGGPTAKYFSKVFEKIFTNLPKKLLKEIFNDEFLFDLDRQSLFDKVDVLLLVLKITDSYYMCEVIQNFPILDYTKEGKIERLDLFMRKILKSDNERNSRKEEILSSIDNILISKYIEDRPVPFEEVDKLLDYFSSCNEERVLLKETRINCFNVCEKLIIKGWLYDRAENFLKWRFDTQEKINQFRETLDNSWFIRERLWESYQELLNSPNEFATNPIRDYCEFFFGYPEEERFSCIRDEFYDYREKLIEQFLRYHGKFAEIDMYSQCNQSQFLKWICKSEERRNEIVRSYRDDRERGLFCKILVILSKMGFCNSFKDLGSCVLQEQE